MWGELPVALEAESARAPAPRSSARSALLFSSPAKLENKRDISGGDLTLRLVYDRRPSDPVTLGSTLSESRGAALFSRERDTPGLSSRFLVDNPAHSRPSSVRDYSSDHGSLCLRLCAPRRARQLAPGGPPRSDGDRRSRCQARGDLLRRCRRHPRVSDAPRPAAAYPPLAPRPGPRARDQPHTRTLLTRFCSLRGIWGRDIAWRACWAWSRTGHQRRPPGHRWRPATRPREPRPPRPRYRRVLRSTHGPLFFNGAVDRSYLDARTSELSTGAPAEAPPPARSRAPQRLAALTAAPPALCGAVGGRAGDFRRWPAPIELPLRARRHRPQALPGRARHR